MQNKAPRFRGWWRVGAAVTGLGALVLGLGGKWAVTQVLPYSVVGTSRLERTFRYAGVTPATMGLQAEAFNLEVASGIDLKGWFVRSTTQPAKGTVVLLHGHNSCKEAVLRLAKLLAAHGFNSLAYDSRGCGESGGKYCTFGFYEKRDCSLYVDALLRKHGEEIGPVSIYGNSFGGAVALQTMAANRRFRCGIVESTFATLKEVVRDYSANMIGVRLDALTDAALARGAEIARFSPDEVQPEEAARSIRCPVMVVHGTRDANISCSYGARIYRQLTTEGSRWYPVAGGDHGNLWTAGGEAYKQEFLAFLEAHGTR